MARILSLLLIFDFLFILEAQMLTTFIIPMCVKKYVLFFFSLFTVDFLEIGSEILDNSFSFLGII